MRSLLMMVSRWHRADDKVSCAEGYRCIYIRPNCDCITCTSEASRPISQGILSFYSGGHINHFFYHVRQRPYVLRELFDAIRKDVLTGSLSRHRMTDLRGFGAHKYPPRRSTVFLVPTIQIISQKLTDVFCWWDLYLYIHYSDITRRREKHNITLKKL